jgi:hypothetical protein
MLVLDALFDHFQQISSNVEIIGSLVQCSPISAIDVRVELIASIPRCPHFRLGGAFSFHCNIWHRILGLGSRGRCCRSWQGFSSWSGEHVNAAQNRAAPRQARRALYGERFPEARCPRWRGGRSRLPRPSAHAGHACGFKLANDGVDTRALQAYLGHRSIQHTVRYTALSPDRFKRFWKE